MRGAWIETLGVLWGVSRERRRSPCGGRGLKPLTAYWQPIASAVAPHAGGVD